MAPLIEPEQYPSSRAGSVSSGRDRARQRGADEEDVDRLPVEEEQRKEHARQGSDDGVEGVPDQRRRSPALRGQLEHVRSSPR